MSRVSKWETLSNANRVFSRWHERLSGCIVLEMSPTPADSYRSEETGVKLNNIQKAVLTIGVLAEVFLVVDWFGNKGWLVPGDIDGAAAAVSQLGRVPDWVTRALRKQTEMFWTWTTVVTVVTGGLVLLWKSKK